MTAWRDVALADVCRKPQYGAIAKGSEHPIGPRFVRQSDITSGRIDWRSVPYCDLDPADFEKYAIHAGDLLISRLGAGVGTAATVDDDNGAVFAGYLVRFQPHTQGADPRFLGYQLHSSEWWNHVNGFRFGAAQPTLNAQQMGAFRFSLPPIEEQQRIAATLGALDDKINSNHSAIEYTEQLGAAVLASQVGLDVYGFPEYDDKSRIGDILDVLETGSRRRGPAHQIASPGSGEISDPPLNPIGAGKDRGSRHACSRGRRAVREDRSQYQAPVRVAGCAHGSNGRPRRTNAHFHVISIRGVQRGWTSHKAWGQLCGVDCDE